MSSEKVSSELLNKLQISLKFGRNRIRIVSAINAFHAAIISIQTNDESTRYRVEGISSFNNVIELCVNDLEPALRRFLRLKKDSKIPPNKSPYFPKIKTALHLYVKDLIKLIDCLSSSNIVTILLKHLYNMSPFVICYVKQIRSILRILIKIWGSATSECVRILAFKCILHILSRTNTKYLEFSVKKMYLTYVMNSKFINTDELAMIIFMRRSLAELFAMDLSITYKSIFLYIRKLAVNLRNAITLNTKESFQGVYNWQFINSLRLWTNLISICYDKSEVQQLTYPLIQIIVGTIKLIPTVQYYPLRFHCIKMLIELSKNTNLFIPLQTFILEVLENYDFNKKHKRMSMRPIDFTCLFRLSKAQLEENGVKDVFIESVYDLLSDYLANNCHSLAFPDLTFMCLIKIKKFVKECNVANYCKKMKSIVDKIEKTNEVIYKHRTKLVDNSLNDTKVIEALEREIANNEHNFFNEKCQ